MFSVHSDERYREGRSNPVLLSSIIRSRISPGETNFFGFSSKR
jgi:hypothetical protein